MRHGRRNGRGRGSGPAALAALALLLSALPAAGARFHDGGEEKCVVCHEEARGSDPSSTCLNCHSSVYPVLTEDGSSYTPGGDFFWLRKSYAAPGHVSLGDSHGHNVVSADFGLSADGSHPLAPGNGAVRYESGWLSCVSCHNPHIAAADPPWPAGDAAKSAFRLLAGSGYRGGPLAQGISFIHDAPVARGYRGENDRWPAETDSLHTDYGSGMSEWCTNCHSGYLRIGHPAGPGAKLGRLAKVYRAYRATGSLTREGGALDHLVPFERGAAETVDLDPTRSDGPSGSAQVMCLSCHRAHATPFRHAGRWDLWVGNLLESPVWQSGEAEHAWYGEDPAGRYGAAQKSLCNKCHQMD